MNEFPMKMLRQTLPWLLSFGLVACGGGGGSAGTSLYGDGSTTPTSSAASVDLIASAVQVPSAGDQVTVTATVKDAGNVGLAAAPITFSTDTGTLTSAASKTDASGTATVVLSAGSNRNNRTIVVTATSGSVSGTISLPVVGTKLTVAGVTTVKLGGTASLTVTAVDSKSVAIAGLSIAVTSSLNNGLSATTITTDALGNATLTYTATNAGTDTLNFTGGGTSAAATTITVSAEDFAFLLPDPDTSVPVTVKQPVSVRYASNGVPQSGKTVSFAATAGSITVADTSGTTPTCTSTTAASTTTTNASGVASVCIASATAGSATVQATLTGVAGVAAQATLPISFVAVTPAKLVLQVSPTALSPNTSTSSNQKATVLATVTDAVGNPVSGVTVDFNRCLDPSGGSLTQPSAVTSSSGQASVQYAAGPTSTASNGVLLQATVEGSSAITLPACSAGASNSTNNTASLTVNQSALFIALGTGNTVVSLDTQTYQKDWVVYVTDSNGVAVSNVNVTIKVLPVQYRKGVLSFQTPWDYDFTKGIYTCANEDANYNGTLDPAATGVPAEDANGDGIIEPGNVVSVTTSATNGASSGTVTTGSTGRATISLVYAKSYSKWVQVKLVAAAVVSGTESTTQAVFWAPGAAPDYSSQTVSPPGETSPFGTNNCTTAN
jgi:hypothetical protein